MPFRTASGSWRASWAWLWLLTGVVVAASGCRTAGFYAQAIKGQCQVFVADKPIRHWLEDPEVPASLKKRFELVGEVRRFAETELKLAVNGHYQKYADLGRPFVLWNVQAAPEFSLQPKTWWYPFVGGLEYRGYFSLRGATNYAAFLRRKGYDVAVGGVQAYSTLGWFKDPVLNTFIFEPDAQLAELIFHELAHQRLFARGDTDFSEAFATTVGQEGARRWLRAKGDPAALAEYEAYLKRNAEFVQVVVETRTKLEALFGGDRTQDTSNSAGAERTALSREELRGRKQRIYAGLQEALRERQARWSGSSQYDDWLGQPINNAHLNSVATYYELVPALEKLLESQGGDLGAFYDAAAGLARKPKRERLRWLQALAVPAHD